MNRHRRDFLRLSGAVAFLPSLVPSAYASRSQQSTQGGARAGKGPFEPLPYTGEDTLSLAKGFSWSSIASTGDIINANGDRFGDCCDFTAFFAGKDESQGFLWVNHEYLLPHVHAGKKIDKSRTRQDVEAEMKMVGGSFLELKRTSVGAALGPWTLVSGSKRAFRVDAQSAIPLVGPAGGRTVRGTMGNCGGGTTPWGSVLSGEENVQDYYDKVASEDNYGWGEFFDGPEHDYGWVVEVDTETGKARKLTALGRFAHEGATVALAKDGRVVVYMGDDAAGQCLYKFISAGKVSGDPKKDRDLLLEGNLYCADLKAGKWLHLDPSNPKLAAAAKADSKIFATLPEILRNTRKAAQVAGGTPLNRPEDVKVHPRLGTVYFTLTNNVAAGDFHGQVVMLTEENDDHAQLSFSYDTHLVGGPGRGFSCPDNLCFGPGDHLWVCTDISGSAMGKGAHASFARNSLLRLEHDSKNNLTTARHFLQSPLEAEVTGPCFDNKGSTFFLSIQHPGEFSFLRSPGYSSHWPRGGSNIPLSTVVAIQEQGASFSR
jgi:secreted PhoX family phosphatase